jgi:hypothetical protein
LTEFLCKILKWNASINVEKWEAQINKPKVKSTEATKGKQDSGKTISEMYCGLSFAVFNIFPRKTSVRTNLP